MERQSHWENVHSAKKPDEVTWYQEHLMQSRELIRGTGLPHSARLVDIGAGSSTLVDDLLEEGYSDLTVVDISEAALQMARDRLETIPGTVVWLQGDITELQLPENRYDLWHDRAVFHFLTHPDDRKAYLANMNRSLKPGGHLVMATFSLSGPRKCSGLDIVRYDPDSLAEEIGPGYSLARSVEEVHRAQSGMTQDFIYCHFMKDG